MGKRRAKQNIVDSAIDVPTFDMSSMPVMIQLAESLSNEPFDAEKVQAMMHRSPSSRHHKNKPFTTADYMGQRPAESDPKGWEKIFAACDAWYQKNGLVRNIIDLMSDFCVAGIQVSSPDPNDQRTLRTWFKKVRGQHVSERLANMLYRLGNVGVRRILGEGTAKVQKEFQESMAKMKIEIKIPKEITSKGAFPYKYVPIDPSYVKMPDPMISAFLEEPYYELQIVKDPMQEVQSASLNKADRSKLIKKIKQPDVKEALESGKPIPLDNDRFRMLHYKKDINKKFAYPLIYAAIDCLTLYEKMMLADRNIVDSAIKHITFLQVGDPKNGLVASEQHVVTLAEDINDAGAGGSKSIVVTPAPLTLHESKGTLATFLGKVKFDAVLEAIYATFGIPSALTGTASGAAANNYMAMKVLIKKLEYVRQILKEFWLEEIRQVCEAFGITSKVFLTYTYQELGDEAAIKTLIEAMYDRKAISLETYRYLMGADHELEEIRVGDDREKRRQGEMPPQAGPFHSEANFETDAKKIAIQGGAYTLEDVGIQLDDIKHEPQIRKSRLEVMNDLQMKVINKQSDLKMEEATHQNTLDIKYENEIPPQPAPVVGPGSPSSPPRKKVVKKAPSKAPTKKAVKKQPGEPGKGRPRNQRDTKPRQERTYKGPRKT